MSTLRVNFDRRIANTAEAVKIGDDKWQARVGAEVCVEAETAEKALRMAQAAYFRLYADHIEAGTA